MKRISLFIMALLLFSFASCNAKQADDTTKEISEESYKIPIDIDDTTEEASEESHKIPINIEDTTEETSDEISALWIDKKSASFTKGQKQDEFQITEIHSDCFYAMYWVPLPYTFKFNGKLESEWCVGDTVTIVYENIYESKTGDGRFEADLVSIEQSNVSNDPFVCYKPVIYLYPEAETEISVSLKLNGRLTCSYPAYNGGWNVTAAPDGTLTDGNGQSYNYLYWEGETDAEWDTSHGFCVRGEDTAVFLEEALSCLGLTRREANEFIVYWLPLMQENAYNIISFQTDVYTDAARLEITPKPDTLIRVFMTYSAAESFIEIPPQKLIAPERTGFAVVEWGGTEIE